MRTVRWLLVGAGALVMAYAVAGALGDPDVKGGVVLFLAGVLVAHDAVLMPLVIGAGALLTRWVPARVRGVVQGALLAGLAVTVVALPLLTGAGRSADDPSLLPRPYGRGLLIAYAMIAGTAAVMLVRRARAGRRRPDGP